MNFINWLRCKLGKHEWLRYQVPKKSGGMEYHYYCMLCGKTVTT